MTDIRQTPEYAQYLSKIGWKIENESEVFSFIKPFLTSSVLKIPRPEKLEVKVVQQIAQKYKSVQIIVEPKDEIQEKILKENKFKTAREISSITKTLHMDLTKSLNSISEEFAKDTPNYLKKAADLKVYSVNNIEKFRQSWKESVPLFRHVPSTNSLSFLQESFGKKIIFLVTPDGSSGAIFLKGDESVHYWQAFSSRKGREDYAQYKILWSGISWAKNIGAKIFDFEGIYDERYPNKSWLGFTHFKKSFGGEEVYFPPSYTKILLPNLVGLNKSYVLL
ncbi:hypothetical protein A2962_00675 [Candidatus Woesebacteria bacterium RIFCSPLOWO2_01_FULL_39_61]|uniref:BioF2-like acetyltransferase domain-containing protein n=1 Tax=Candidatus Woesebacteria bacterium RIFCSPHIGHO2_02_FULL_39_13 TaxID=1802505 RepID=A0A1F7Z224_9BACT|nr:MAG: hypothetical protein A2692_04805 [Candidatus Woesebacteria bacterium RIFCSPHIGHO2_01_FULL_39_95]OGM33577.1 MAG: hypothetical protein A3D01_01320 [Candidatus Woesebacteria bacterium RIFCSPHIGHO2_02_FULL_39_13]OGM36693.1 MAG: hypothetical protein A3E13_00170 [Candidatus Woesebacteria bacterium RIFCSPHIGHO2_12_FULL_40_20]OGM68566.1 MAG: hypothetical protein A2962_00675 [Candidatus Woesebacteria bacterium RIFCSPLOWO2_01_FULL_39_61]OGM75037.1 MAG: hypothetical protein A3H19_02130 [Candidatus